MSIIPIYGRHGITTGSFVVDVEDADAVSQWRWNLGSKGYVIRTDRSTGRKRTVRLHRWLLGLADGDLHQGDHIDGDPLNCRRENLRVVTQSSNAQNRKVNRTSSSGVRGVRRRKEHSSKPWVAHARIDGKQRTLGYFATIEEATEAAAAARRQHMPMSVVGR